MKIYNEYLWLKKWSLGVAVPILGFIDFRKWANGWEVEIGLLGPAPTWLALEPNLSHRSSCRDWVTCLPIGMDPGHLLPGRLINLGGTCQNWGSAGISMQTGAAATSPLSSRGTSGAAKHTGKSQKRREVVWALLPPAVWPWGSYFPLWASVGSPVKWG